MKLIFSLTLIFFVASFCYSQTIVTVDNPQPVLDSIQRSSTKLKGNNITSTNTSIRVARFLKYLNDNKSFKQLLISFGVSKSNELYFIALAANIPANATSMLTEKSGKEFSSSGRIGSIENAGGNKADQNRFAKGVGNTLTIQRYYLDLEEMRTQFQQLLDASINTTDVDIVLTQATDGQTHMGLVFQSDNAPTGQRSMFSTFSSGATRRAPASGCPPFNCDY